MRAITLASSLTALLAGCAVGPDYVRPEVQKPQTLTRASVATALPVSTASDIGNRWWQAFGNAELNSMVQEALSKSPSIEAAQATLRAAHQNVVAQRGYFLPSVQLGYSPSRQNTGQSVSPPLNNGESLYTYHTAQLSVSYAPDLFGGNRRQVEGLQAAEENQRLQLQAARLSLAANLVAAVIQTSMLQEQADLLQQATNAAQQQLQHMRKQQANGYASGMDVATQQTLLLQLQQQLVPLQKSLEQTRNLVATLMAHTPDQAPALLPLSSFRMPLLPQVVPSQLVDQRPDIRAAETQVQQASAAVGVATAARLPQLSISAAYGGGATTFARMFSAGNVTWALGANLLAPLFNGGTLRAHQKAAEAELQASAASYQSTVLSAFQDVANALYAVDADSRALQMSQDSESASQTTWKLSDSQLKAGYASMPTALAAKQSWLQAQAARVAAQGSLYGDVVALYQSLGGGVLGSDKSVD
ncbi:efflux transporter outer membrane subunit [Comamonas sp. Tr-654]|uniref:efflux transporter outer membrane subunit n=1 Tax=Comamonas sp. Tr-654 TaxID=2608341 RepID=UPI0014243137|nr:efflux transporter outer membrane subunit [Comamonas sp. Tr-654]